MAVGVDLLALVRGSQETQLGNEDARLEDCWAGVQPCRASVPSIGEQRHAQLACCLGPGLPQLADALAGQSLILLAELVPSLPDDEAERRHRMRRREGGQHSAAAEIDLVPGRER